MIRIGLSSCFLHADPKRNVFKGKTLLYMEQSATHWLMSKGVLPILLPDASGKLKVKDVVKSIDGLVLQAGADVSPKSYGEEPLRPEWAGDTIRDQHEISLYKECLKQDKPIFGLCRGLQLINVAQGGSLFQDIQTQNPKALKHRDWEIYDSNHHDVVFEQGSHLAKLYDGIKGGRINSIHHQSIKDPGKKVVIEARSKSDGIIEAIRVDEKKRFVFGVQWHPEWIPKKSDEFISSEPLLKDFLKAVKKRGS